MYVYMCMCMILILCSVCECVTASLIYYIFMEIEAMHVCADDCVRGLRREGRGRRVVRGYEWENWEFYGKMIQIVIGVFSFGRFNMYMDWKWINIIYLDWFCSHFCFLLFFSSIFRFRFLTFYYFIDCYANRLYLFIFLQFYFVMLYKWDT